MNVGTANDKSNLHESSNTVIRCVAEAIETNSSTKVCIRAVRIEDAPNLEC